MRVACWVSGICLSLPETLWDNKVEGMRVRRNILARDQLHYQHHRVINFKVGILVRNLNLETDSRAKAKLEETSAGSLWVKQLLP